MAGLRERLDVSAGEGVFFCDRVNGHFVAEVAELEGRVEASVNAEGFDFGGCDGGEGTAIGPVMCKYSN